MFFIKSQLETFIDSLRLWNEQVQPEITDFKTSLFILLFKIGSVKAMTSLENQEEEMLVEIKERVLFLINEQRMHEDFLVNGLVNDFTEFLESRITKHGDFIQFADHLEKSMEKVPDSLKVAKELGYSRKARRELKGWNMIVAQNMSQFEREEWENNRMHKVSKNFKIQR